MEQRDKLGLSPRGKGNTRNYAEPTSAMDKVQVGAPLTLVICTIMEKYLPSISIFSHCFVPLGGETKAGRCPRRSQRRAGAAQGHGR
jgi:hypothetical protein